MCDDRVEEYTGYNWYTYEPTEEDLESEHTGCTFGTCPFFPCADWLYACLEDDEWRYFSACMNEYSDTYLFSHSEIASLSLQTVPVPEGYLDGLCSLKQTIDGGENEDEDDLKDFVIEQERK